MGTKTFFKRRFERRSIYISFFLISFCASCSRQPVYPEPSLKGSEVAIEVKKLRPENPLFLTYRHHRKNINFFVLKIDDKVVSFLDACMSCYPSKRGYRFDGGYITCKTCDIRYSLAEIEEGVGSCSPIRLEGHLQDGNYLIPVSLLEESADKF